jgi:asparagine synthase (glutamine-hydrolysing)
VQPRPYWDLALGEIEARPEAEVAEELRARLREAVRIRLMSEVPLGAFLSGGLDSSAVVAMMAGLSAAPVKTCSISFDDETYSEAPYAALVARRFGTDHLDERVEPDGLGLVDRLARVYDEPFADSSAIPTYRVSEVARRRVTVALSGDGGDETFLGYRRYRWHQYEERVRNLLPSGVRGAVFGPLARTYPKLDWAPRYLRAKTTFESLARPSLEGYFHAVSMVPDRVRLALYSPEFRRELAGYHAIEVLRGHAANAGPRDSLSFAQYLDFKTYLPGDILVKADRASMAHSLEMRMPLLDHTLVDWVARLPSDLKLRRGRSKYIFKSSLHGVLPTEILERPKMGFSVPLADWLRGPLAERVRSSVLGPRLANTGWFEPRVLHRLVDQHRSGLRDHSAALWALLVFDAFLGRVAR